MERCALMKRSLAMAPHRRVGTPSPTSLPSSSSSIPSFASSCRALRVLAMASSEDFGLQWQPVFRFEQADLIADAPSLLKTCEDFDWRAQANELRARAARSLNITQAPESQGKDVKESRSSDNGDTWFAAGLALATATLSQCCFHLSVLAAEEATQKSEAAEAASRAPAWLTPALLAFPLVSYAIFNVYRDQVNPSAKMTDWIFGVAAVVIIANLVLISTIGVRLY